MPKQINTTTIKTILASLGYKDIKNLGPNSFGVVVARTKVDKLIPQLAVAFRAYKPVVASDRELRIGDKSIFAKNRELQRGKAAHSLGRGNEWNFIAYLREWMDDYGKPMRIRFIEDGRVRFQAKRIAKVEHTGAKNVFQRKKADVHLIDDAKKAVPLSIKDINASYWESVDSYWGRQSARFLEWALQNAHTSLEENGYGGYSLRPPIAVPANASETKDVVFGSDLYRKGAVIINRFDASSMKWNYQHDCLDIQCKEVIADLPDVKGPHEVYFEVRNERSRNPQYLQRGLRAMATMKLNLAGDKIFSATDRAKIGI